MRFADHRYYQPPPMRRAAMLEEKDALPRAELQFAVRDRDYFTRSSEHHPNVRRGIITAFRRVREAIRAFRNETLEECIEVYTSGLISVLEDDETRARVLDENGRRSSINTASCDDLAHFICNLVCAFAFRLNRENFRVRLHLNRLRLAEPGIKKLKTLER